MPFRVGQWVVTPTEHHAKIIKVRDAGKVDIAYSDHKRGNANHVNAYTLRLTKKRFTRSHADYDSDCSSSGWLTNAMCQTGESSTEVGYQTDDSTGPLGPKTKLYRPRPAGASAAPMLGDTKTIMVRVGY